MERAWLLLAVAGLLLACGSTKDETPMPTPTPAPPDATVVPVRVAPLVIVGRLDDNGGGSGSAPDCGTLHVAVPMRYQVVRVEQGAYTDAWIVVIHGCPELTRKAYRGADGGDLQRFRPGDLHRLEVGPDVPSGVAVHSGGMDYGQTPRFWATRVDLGPECVEAKDCAPDKCCQRTPHCVRVADAARCDGAKCGVVPTADCACDAERCTP